MFRQLPNALSASRILLAIAFPFIDPRWQPIVIVIAAFTDLADGYIARRFDLTSWAGGLIDGIADKLFVLAVLVTYVSGGDIEVWQFFVLMTRDLIVAGIAGYAAVTRQWSAFRAMPPRLLGKLTTGAMFPYLVLVLTGPPPAEVAFFWLTGGLSMAAGLDYLIKFARRQYATLET